jgi:DNA polymerase-1
MALQFGKGCHLHLIDGSAFIFRAYHALPPLTRKSDGLPIGAVSGFCNMLQRYVEENNGPDAPTHVAVILTKAAIHFVMTYTIYIRPTEKQCLRIYVRKYH